MPESLIRLTWGEKNRFRLQEIDLASLCLIYCLPELVLLVREVNFVAGMEAWKDSSQEHVLAETKEGAE